MNPAMHFNGADYQPTRDDARLTGQILRVWNLMQDGGWGTLHGSSQATGDPHASVSAQLRHLRKDRFGAHCVEREYIDNGLYRYRIVAPLRKDLFE